MLHGDGPGYKHAVARNNPFREAGYHRLKATVLANIRGLKIANCSNRITESYFCDYIVTKWAPCVINHTGSPFGKYVSFCGISPRHLLQYVIRLR